jgi:hypothetical protein
MLKLSIAGPINATRVSRTPGQLAEIWRDSQGQIAAYSEITDEYYWIHLPGIGSFRFSENEEAVTATAVTGVAEETILDVYHRKILPIALQVRGYEVLHASAVSSRAGVVALCGVSETGKSTIAFGLSRRGYEIWADDAVTFEINGHGPLALSLPFNSRLRPAASDFFSHDQGSLVGRMDSADVEKAALLGVCVLRRDHQTPVTSARLPPSTKGLAALLDHACWFIPQTSDRKRQMIEHYLNIVAEIPVYDICFPSGMENLSRVLDVIEDVIAEIVPGQAFPSQPPQEL